MTDTRLVVAQWFRLLLAAALTFVSAPLASVADEPRRGGEKPDVTITPAPARGNVFGDTDAEFRFRIDASRAAKGRVVWRVAAGTATVKAGEVDLAVAATAPAEVIIKIAIPPVKDGVVLQTRLALSVVEVGQSNASATFEQDLWIFPRDPFADRLEWLKKLKITLFDPKGDTEKVFAAMKLPFEEVRSVDTLADVKEGVVVIGEGTTFADEKGLGTALVKLAAEGRTVLILAPAPGELVVPGIGGPVEELDGLTFRREFVRKLDKRLDPDGWLPNGKAVVSTLIVKMGEDAVAGVLVGGPGGWPWVETEPGPGKGRWAFCGLAVIAKWEAGPTPRFLFARMLEYLTDSLPEQPKKENER